MKKQRFYQMHECGGYRAMVTIEWQHPDKGYNGEHVSRAEDLADEAMAEVGPQMRDIVQTMRGRR